MSVKSFIKKHCPSFLLPLIRVPYRYSGLRRLSYHHRISQTIKKADKFLPYYQDELSKILLADHERFLRTQDENIFIDRAKSEGWRFNGIYAGVGGGYEFIDPEKFSGLVLIYDDDDSDNLKRSKNLLSISDWAEKYRCLTLADFLNNVEVKRSELIVPVLSEKKIPEFFDFMRRNNMFYSHHVRFGNLSSIREDEQYFDVFEPVDDEIIIDAGCYDGATAINFLKWGQGKVKKIYSFEFDPVNAEICERNLQPYQDKITLVKKGTWDKDETLHVNPSGSSGSSVRSEGNVEVQLTAIDNVVKDEKVTFIKMDVEGAELKSLMGARNTITKNHPRLAICMYHKLEDLYEIPEYILSLVPEYKFYLRHYDSNYCELVLYAYC